jgi:hypothetical protein
MAKKHLLINRWSLTYTHATGEPVKPGGFNANGLTRQNTLVMVDICHDADVDKVEDRACNFL